MGNPVIYRGQRISKQLCAGEKGWTLGIIDTSGRNNTPIIYEAGSQLPEGLVRVKLNRRYT